MSNHPDKCTEHTMGWISVKDKPPPKDRDFLAHILVGTYTSGKDTRTEQINTCIWDDYYNRFIENCNCSGYDIDVEHIEIIHWMLLPKPSQD